MYEYLLSAIIYLCLLPTGLRTEDCFAAVLASRDTAYVPEGGGLSLFCDIQHCGDTWTGEWLYKDKTDNNIIQSTDRLSVTNETLSATTARLFLTFLSVNQSDEGFYGCTVKWGQGSTAQGHYTYLNITAALPKRKLWHRLLICSCACLCPFITLGLARCLGSEVNPQPLPRTHFTDGREDRNARYAPPKPPPRHPVPKKRSNCSHRAPAQAERKTELVYADLSPDALRPQEATKQPNSSIVYSSVRFS